MILVSACLVGQACRYNGESKSSPHVMHYLHNKAYITFCPELLGGLKIPREPAEIISESGQVKCKSGTDVTQAFELGAKRTLELAIQANATCIISKEGSPSCGVRLISDGSFTKKKIKGCGLTTQLLKREGFIVYSEEDI